MVLWIVNELSLDHQFASPKEFTSALRSFLKARQKSETVRASLRITSEIADRPVCADYTFREAVLQEVCQIERQQVFRWLANQGPFWTTDRSEIQDDLFYCCTEDVTDTGLGETARRRLNTSDVRAVSFSGSRALFDSKTITLTHGLLQAPIGLVTVPNITDVSALVSLCSEMPVAPTNWPTALESLAEKFPDVWFSPNLGSFLDGQPFMPAVYDRTIELIGVLNEMVKSRDANGAWTEEGKHLYETYFVGETARFTDESSTNKSSFKGGMTFHRQSGEQEMCSFHGKIKTQQYRIHFPWPLEAGKPLEIVYIGPKITKT